MRTSLPQVARVGQVTDESPRVRTFTLDARLEALPGQFVMVWLPGVDEKPFSLVRADPVTLTVARVGPFTAALHALRPGDRLWLRGPLGHGFTLPGRKLGKWESGKVGNWTEGPPNFLLPILLVAGGYGVAPLHFLAERALAAGWRVSAVIGARTAADVIFAGRFAALGMRVEVTTDDGSLGRRGMATDAAAALLDEELHAALYACGPEPMLAAVERLAQERDLPAQLSYERYMRCGFGVCGTCQRDGRLVCRDGPVFHLGGRSG